MKRYAVGLRGLAVTTLPGASHSFNSALHVPLCVHLPSEGVNLRLEIEGKHIFMYYLFPNMYT